SRMMMVEDRMETFPSLVYDGPYSDHVLERRPAEADRAEVGEEEAEKAARSFLPEGASAEARRVRAAGASSPVAAYGFEFRTQEEGGVATLTRLDVARRGGEVLWMLKNRPPKPIQISESEAA